MTKNTGASTHRRLPSHALRRWLIVAALASSALPVSAGAVDAAPAVDDALRRIEQRLGLPQDAVALDIEMSGRRFSAEQSRRPADATLEVPATQSVLLADDGRFRLRTHTRYPGGIEFKYLTVGSAQGSATIDPMQWREGIEIQRDPAEGAAEDHADLLFFAPAMLLRDIRARHAPVAVTEDGTRIDFNDAAGRSATLTVDAATGTPQALDSGARRYLYTQYRRHDGWLQPGAIEQLRNGKPAARWDKVSAAMAAVPSDAFALPSGYVEKVAAGELRATSLGQGAYRVDGAPSGYHTGFVVGDDAIAVFDAPIAVDEAAQVKALIRRTAPGKRIAYVVVSHPHGDHVAGLPAYLDAGVEVLAGRDAGVALRRQLGDKAPKTLVEVTAPRQLQLGKRTVDVYPLASSHSDAMLVGYAADARTIFQGDLFYLPEIGPVPPAFEGSVELSGLIARQRLTVEHIVGVHGRTGDAGDLEESLRLRKAAAARDR